MREAKVRVAEMLKGNTLPEILERAVDQVVRLAEELVALDEEHLLLRLWTALGAEHQAVWAELQLSYGLPDATPEERSSEFGQVFFWGRLFQAYQDAIDEIRAEMRQAAQGKIFDPLEHYPAADTRDSGFRG